MRCAKLIRSLVLGENIHDPLLLYQRRHGHDDSHHYEEETDENDDHDRCRSHSCLFFLPTHETIHDTRKLAAIARDMGMNFTPDPSLTHILFSWPPPPPQTSSSSSLTSAPLITNTTTIPLPFPCLSSASASHLRRFARISKGLFTLVTCCCCNDTAPEAAAVSGGLFSRLSGEKIQDMEALARALTGNGWALFKTTTPTLDGGGSFVFRKVEPERDGMKAKWWCKEEEEEEEEEYCRVREVSLPWLDFGHAVPTRILHYILLMTDDLFYLA